MSEMYEFGPNDGFVKRVHIPGDYLGELATKVARAFEPYGGATKEQTHVCANGWAVKSSVREVWERMLDFMDTDRETYLGTLPFPLRSGTRKRIGSMIFFGNTLKYDPPEIEAIRLQVVEAVAPYAHSRGIEL
jgi:hypothetical protein